MTPTDLADLVSTYSIVARDPDTGELGVAVQSHYFCVGSVVPWLEPGVGAVATQAMVEIAHGPRGVAAMRRGATAPDALRESLALDPDREIRQVSMVDAQGNAAVHTGSRCIRAAGHRLGEGYAAQGNMLRSDAVWRAVANGYEQARGLLAERLLSALEAAERVGGDIRGRQSAALVVVSGVRSDRPWQELRVDLRVDDHADPLGELRRLLAMHEALAQQPKIQAAIRASDDVELARRLEHAEALMPGNPEVAFWVAVSLILCDRDADALPLLRRAYAIDPGWRELVRRLVEVGILPDDAARIEALCAA